MDETKKKLRRMAIWLIAVFAAVFAAVMTILWQLTGGVGFNSVLMALKLGWTIYVIVGVICIAVYFIYKWFITRKK